MDGDPNKLLDYVKCYIRSFDNLGNKNGHRFVALHIIIVVASALTPFLNSFVGNIVTDIAGYEINEDTVKVYTSLLAVISAVSVGMLQLAQAGEKMTLEKITRVSLEREILLYNTKARIYSRTDNQPFTGRRKLFAQQVAEIMVNKFNKYYSINPRDHTSALPPSVKNNNQLSK